MHCKLCQGDYCKKCIEFLPQETFSFMGKIPEDLTHDQYCLTCYSSKIRPQLIDYNATMKKAKQVLILDKPRRKPLAILKKFEEPLTVIDCPDREETVLRLAFKAAELGCNSVIKANIIYKKVRNAGYQKMMWQGTGFAAEIKENRLDD